MKTIGPVISPVLLLLIGFAAGIGSGAYLWRHQAVVFGTAEPASPPAPAAGDRTAPAETLPAGSLSRFEQHEQAAIRLISSHRYAQALEQLFEADLAAAGDAEARQVSGLLEEAVRLRVTQLNALGRSAEIDALYERLTFAMPERAEYYILLAEHRIAMDSPDRALPVLAQIENHHQLGGRARELIDTITAVNQVGLLDIVPLTRLRDQYLVQAKIDDGGTVTLMLDTGASMTVIGPDALARLGYALTDRTASFATAGGMVQAPLVSIGALTLGESRVEPLTVGALAIPGQGNDVDGLLGMDFLRHFEFSLDQDSGRLNLHARRPDP